MGEFFQIVRYLILGFVVFLSGMTAFAGSKSEVELYVDGKRYQSLREYKESRQKPVMPLNQFNYSRSDREKITAVLGNLVESGMRYFVTETANAIVDEPASEAPDEQDRLQPANRILNEEISPK